MWVAATIAGPCAGMCSRSSNRHVNQSFGSGNPTVVQTWYQGSVSSALPVARAQPLQRSPGERQEASREQQLDGVADEERVQAQLERGLQLAGPPGNVASAWWSQGTPTA